MRIIAISLLAFSLVACSNKPNAVTPSNLTETTPTGPCCCITADNKDGDIGQGAMTAKACSDNHGSCASPSTEQCKQDLALEQAAGDRLEADHACPSGDRHDCN